MRKLFTTILLSIVVAGCSSGQMGAFDQIEIDPNQVPVTKFTIQDTSQLIGGPLATGRVGDVLLENDKIRLIIEQPGKTPWVGNYGGGIVDVDLVREDGVGHDNFSFMHPLVNVEWTVRVLDYEVIKDGSDGGEKVFRTYGVVDEFDYLDLDFVSPVAKAITGQELYFSPRFDDVNDPFQLTELANLNIFITTEYVLKPGKNYVEIKTTYENISDEELYLPVGDLVNGGGEVSFLIPGLGFTPEMMPQIQGETPALIYVGFNGSDVSYGYFYDLMDFSTVTEEGEVERFKSTSLSYSGVTGILLGDDFLKVLPLGNKSRPSMNTKIAPNSSRTITRYFVVGDSNGGSVFDTGMKILGIPTNTISGIVRNAEGKALPGATVAVKNEEDSTVITYKTGSDGRFSGELPTGEDPMNIAFGAGKYKLSVFKKGYKVKGSDVSGVCNAEEIDIRFNSMTGIECTLGSSGIVKISGGVVDSATGQNVPARMTVVGYKPAYRSKTGGYFEDTIIFERPLGVVDVYYVNANGTIGIDEEGGIRLGAGKYNLVFTRGTEYSMESIPITVSNGSVVDVGPVSITKVINTKGYISADFHLHSIASPDSAMKPERRVLAASGEGMDVIQSSDHDYVLDYGSYYSKLASEGIVRNGSMVTIAGDEISPNHMGHFNVFPLEVDHDKPCGGAFDWSYTDIDAVGPAPDFVQSPQDTVDYFRNLPNDPVIQVNHIADQPTSLFILSGWVTSPFYYESHGVAPLSNYADPVNYRLKPLSTAVEYPYSFGMTEMVVTDYDSIELVIGPELHDDFLLTSSLPTWFNLLNLGLFYTATGDSDSHREIANPLGVPRNFIASDVDPADGMGSFSEFNEDDYVDAIKNHKVFVTTGPSIKVTATDSDGNFVHIGETIVANPVTLTIEVESPDWAWFDTIEIFANTKPIPADDETYTPLEGKALDPAEFFEPYHVPRYYYKPTLSYSLKDKTLEKWKNEDGVISAKVEVEVELERDTWIVVFAKGTEDTEGYRSLFPFVTRALIDADNPSSEPVEVDVGNIDTLAISGAPAWAFTNPIFVDVEGDGFTAIYQDDWGFEKGISKSISKPTESYQAESENLKKTNSNVKTPKAATSVNSNLF